MRIITGSARGIALTTLEGETTRPTAERAKEALFSMIQFDIEGRRALDLFGGSGQLGLEALSRGAASCVFCDTSREAVSVIIENSKRAKLFDKCRISASDYAAALRGMSEREQFDLIFLDPPYESGFLPEALRMIARGNILSPGGRIVCESDNGTLPTARKKLLKDPEHNRAMVLEQVFGGDSELADAFSVIKSSLYGRIRITLLESEK